MNLEITPPRALRGITRVPGDKSISHRAAMLGALAEGDTRIENFLMGADCLATVKCLAEMGVSFTGPDEKGRLTVHGRGPAGLKEPENVLDAGNSGTTIRLMLGILAGLPFFTVITGDASLRRRPMKRVTAPLSRMGARIWGRQGANLAPLAVRGGELQGGSFSLPVASAQVKSALLLAGLSARGETRVVEPAPSRDHTERMLQYFGAEIYKEGLTVTIKGGQVLAGRRVTVPGDISSAAFLMVAAAVVPGSDVTIREVGINPTRDGILEVMRAMGADLEVINRHQLGGEPVADIRVRHSRLRGVTIGGELIPRLIDEIPVLAVAGALAEGELEVRDAAELKVKESNRIATVVEELRKFGVEVEALADGLRVRGGRPLTGTSCTSHGDHRIAMAMAVAGLAARGKTVIQDAGCVDVSFPGFASILSSLRVD
ncbi:3-phosphoshikimate 1-carboxyvinyltransferase [Desulfofundulus kuznetsovii DSM 6115]|jgi:3-phosphoshikimate 1-carboxyvinyltransferase|uniref:3-phosphoshikimate 1-carboxyvinyltransferase n=1 Tax=Desulfofundulus kuznetsovii (strain DSM 6115 / VKM B-1805 / 17) TaxID=760568 RepID=A0AAU8PDA8_DESK7|nr:3-phosphoshikimate 1-carboxyvinyltransferase [Desulfofundulus kuznetsovii DSM 6115]